MELYVIIKSTVVLVHILCYNVYMTLGRYPYTAHYTIYDMIVCSFVDTEEEKEKKKKQ